MVLSLLLWIGCAEYELGFQSNIPSLTNTLDTGTNTYDTASGNNDTQENDPYSENPWNGECGDGLDNDGDGLVDCSDSDCTAAPECSSPDELDTDGDGYPDNDDCNPYNPYVNPGAQEVANNGIDDDCDGNIDNNSSDDTGNSQAETVCSDTCVGDPLINLALQSTGLSAVGVNNGVCEDGGSGDLLSPTVGFIAGDGNSLCPFGTDCSDCGVRIDADGDLHEDDPQGLALYSDCDDTDPTINSSAAEIPGDGIDQDCDGTDGVCSSVTFSIQSFEAGREVTGGVIGDVDGDGYEDVLFSEQLDNKLQLYWGDGSGTFSDQNKLSFSIGRSGAPGTIGDIDNDGDNDILWGLQDSNTIKVIVNNGGRNFTQQSFSEANGPNRLELVDVNGDGNLDLYIYQRFGSCVARKMGNGDGTFGSTDCVTSTRVPFDIVDTDLDGFANFIYSENGTLYTADVDGSGMLQSITNTNIATSGTPKFYDINNDGFMDMFIQDNGDFSEFLNDGYGNFNSCSQYPGLSNGFADVGDLNNDGKIDYIYSTTCGYCDSTLFFAVQN